MLNQFYPSSDSLHSRYWIWRFSWVGHIDLIFGGWADAYTNAVFRLLEGLDVPTRALIGPWAHVWPQYGTPGPAINFLKESLRWWDQWLKGEDTGIMDEPRVISWMQDTMPPRAEYEERPGRWITDLDWPSPYVETATYHLGAATLQREEPDETPVISLRSAEDTGSTSGHWFPHGSGPEMPLDQRLEEGNSLVFETAPMEDHLEVLGQPVARLRLGVDKPQAHLALCLSDVMPDGRATRVSYGMLNLSHRNGHDQPAPLEPGKVYDISIPLNFCGQRFPVGHRIRLAISTAFWPTIWPSPETVTLILHTGDSCLDLPVRPIRETEDPFQDLGEAEAASPLSFSVIEPGHAEWTTARHARSGLSEYVRTFNTGIKKREDIALTFGGYGEERFTINPLDPLSASATASWNRFLERGQWSARAITSTTLTADRETFHVTAELDAYEGDTRIFSRNWSFSIPRDNV